MIIQRFIPHRSICSGISTFKMEGVTEKIEDPSSLISHSEAMCGNFSSLHMLLKSLERQHQCQSDISKRIYFDDKCPNGEERFVSSATEIRKVHAENGDPHLKQLDL